MANEMVKVFENEKNVNFYKSIKKEYNAIVASHTVNEIMNFERFVDKDDNCLELLQQFSDHTIQLLNILQNEYSKCYDMCIRYGILDYNILDFISVINSTHQYVYFIKNKTTGLTKIGRTKELKRRLSEIKRAAL